MALRHTHFRRQASLSRLCLTPSRSPLHAAAANRSSLHTAPSRTSRAERSVFRRTPSSATFSRSQLFQLSQRQFSSTPESPPNANSDTESSSSSAKESVVKMDSAAADADKSASSAKIKTEDDKDDDLTPDQRVKQARAKLQEAFEQYSSAHRERSSTRTLGDLQFVRLITQFDAKMVPGAFLEGVNHAYERFNELSFDENLEELERMLTPDFYEIVTAQLKSRKDSKSPKIKMEISNLETSIRSVSGDVAEPRRHSHFSLFRQVRNYMMQQWNGGSQNAPNSPISNQSASFLPSIEFSSGFDRQVEVEVTHSAKYRYFDRKTDKEITDTSTLPFSLKDGKHSSIYVLAGSSINMWEVKIKEGDQDKSKDETDQDPSQSNQMKGIVKSFNLPQMRFLQNDAVLQKVEPKWLLANVIDGTEAEVTET